LEGDSPQEKNLAVIFNFTGARRIHYGDFSDPKTGTIRYVGEGKTGDQLLNARNRRLRDMSGSAALLDLFLDCGDLFYPKKLLYAGKWSVVKSEYKLLDGRKVHLFTLKAHAVIGKIPQTTSNIWAKEPAKAVDYFVVALLSHESLIPNCVLKISSRNAAQFQIASGTAPA
jgi:hypothetical protein